MMNARTIPRVKGNCDGAVNSDDRGPFKMAVNNPNGYALTYPDCMLELGDLNADGLVNTVDLDLFANVVSSTLLVARRYEYDEENRLTAVAEIDGNPLLEIEYDALGRRIASTDYGVAVDPCTGDAGPVTVQTRHIYAGLNTVAEYISCDGGDWGLAREVLWGSRFPEPLALFDFTAAGDEQAGTEEVLHYVHDALGSVVGLVDAGDPDATPEPIPAKLVERYDYDPYGKTYIESWDASAGGGSGAWVRTTASAYGNPFAWTGQRYDAGVGMYHFPFRSFSPELGRWMQRDPLGYVDGVNFYEYAGSAAESAVDALGLYLDKDVIHNPDGTVTWHVYDRGLTGWFMNHYLGSITFNPDDAHQAWEAEYVFSRGYEFFGAARDFAKTLEISILVAVVGIPGPEDLIFPAFKLFGEVLRISAKEAANAQRLRELPEAAARVAEHARAKHYPGHTADSVMRKILDTIRGAKHIFRHPDGTIVFVKGGRVVIIRPGDKVHGGTMFEPDDLEQYLKKLIEEEGFKPGVCDDMPGIM